MGIVLTADGVAEATAPMLVGYLRDRTGSYNSGFIVLVVAALVGAGAIASASCGAHRAACIPRIRQSAIPVTMRITDANVIVCSPGRNFVTLKLVTEDGVYGLGDATLNGRELAVASYLSRSRRAAAHRPRRAAHRGHLAVPLQRRVLAPRAGDDDRDRRGRHGALGHPGQDAEHAGLPAARRRVARARDGLRPRERIDASTRPSTAVQRVHRLGYKAVRAQCAIPGVRPRVRRRPRHAVLRAGAERACRSRACGAPSAISISCRRCSSACGARSASTCTCCTTCTIA